MADSDVVGVLRPATELGRVVVVEPVVVVVATPVVVVVVAALATVVVVVAPAAVVVVVVVGAAGLIWAMCPSPVRTRSPVEGSNTMPWAAGRLASRRVLVNVVMSIRPKLQPPMLHLRTMDGVPTVLVVDDDPVIQKLLQVNFEMEGYDVVIAGDGEEGLALAREERPDVVLLDVMMPKMNGLDVAAAMRADEITEAIPIIMLSAKAQASDVQAGLDLGVDDYVTKPFDPLELLERVGALLDAR